MNGMKKYKVVCKNLEVFQKIKNYLDKNEIRYEAKDKHNTIKLYAQYDEAVKKSLSTFYGDYSLYGFDKNNDTWDTIDSKPYTLEESEMERD